MKKDLRVVSLFCATLMMLSAGCHAQSKIMPEDIRCLEEEILIAKDECRDLKDIITFQDDRLFLDPAVFTLTIEDETIVSLTEQTIITGKKIGKTDLRIALTAKDSISTTVSLRVIRPLTVCPLKGEGYEVEGLKAIYAEGDEVTFHVLVTAEEKMISAVFYDETLLLPADNGLYRFIMPDHDVIITVTLKKIVPAREISLDPSSLTLALDGDDGSITAVVKPEDSSDEIHWEIIEGSDVISITPDGRKATIHALRIGQAKIKATCSVTTSATADICVKDAPKEPLTATYDIRYDLGEGKRAKPITTKEELRQVFVLRDGVDLLKDVDEPISVYGGGSGGRGETAWYRGDMLKLGTTNVVGQIVLHFKESISHLDLWGYATAEKAELQIGDAKNDGERVMISGHDMTLVSKESIKEEPASLGIDFAPTKDVLIAVTKTKPVYLTALSFKTTTREA